MALEIVSTASRPALAETTGQWRWAAFFARHGRSREEVLAAERDAARDAASPLPTVMVALSDGVPVGMAALAARDLDQRPDLGPWLAGVYVLPAFRQRGHATRLVGAVEDRARGAAIPCLWLYTRSAESLYRRCGWRTAETFERDGRRYSLMRRDLAPPCEGVR